MTRWKKHERVAYLAGAMCSQTISPDEVEELDKVLAEDNEACEFYIDILQLEAELPWLCGALEGGKTLHADLQLPFETSEQSEEHGPSSSLPAPHTRPASLLDRVSRRPGFPAIAIALMAMAVLVFGLSVTPLSKYLVGDNETHENNSAQQVKVARLVRTSNAVWVADRDSLDASSEKRRVRNLNRRKKLAAGQRLYLAAGLAEFKFADGAEVVLEGPAEFEITSKAACRLERGKLVGKCRTEQSKGFTVETPTAEVQDLGTEFGVRVSDNESNSVQTKVAVFTGDVRVRPAANRSEAAWTPIVADETVSVIGSEVLAQAASAEADDEEDDFVRELLPESANEIQRVAGKCRYLRTAPHSVAPRHIDSSPAIKFFAEQHHIPLEQDTRVSTCKQTRCRIGNQQERTLPAGKQVDSYLFTVRPWNDKIKKRPFGSVTFARPVLGVITRPSEMQRTNTSLGHPSVHYPNSGSQLEPNDSIWLSKDRRTIYFSMALEDRQGDRFRVLVETNAEQAQPKKHREK